MTAHERKIVARLAADPYDTQAREAALRLVKKQPHTVKVPPPAGARGTRKERKRAFAMTMREVCEAVKARAVGWCECGCGLIAKDSLTAPPALRGEMDHYRGGAYRKRSTTPEGCWWLNRGCHRAKTENRPAALYWRKKWEAHCARYGYDPDGAR